MGEIGRFGYDNPLNEESLMEELPGSAESPYRYFKSRLYGRLHFVKSIREEYTSDPLVAAALSKEFDIGYSLDHPNIVKYLLIRNGAIYEEFIDGTSLKNILSDENLSRAFLSERGVVEKMIRQLLDALAYLHSKGIVYLDLKPSNIMVTRIGHAVKLIDLGGCVNAVHDNTPAFTRRYATPEQLTDSGNTQPLASTDLYQFAQIAECMLARSGGYDKYKQFLKICRETDPKERPEDAVEALSEFDRIASATGTRLKRHRWISASVAVVVVVTIGTILMQIYNRNNDSNLISESELSSNKVSQSDSIDSDARLSEELKSEHISPVSKDVNVEDKNRKDPKVADKDSWEQYEDETWTYFNEYFNLPPEGDPLHDKILDQIWQRSIDFDVNGHFFREMSVLIEDYARQGLTYATLSETQRKDFDERLKKTGDDLFEMYQESERVAKERGKFKWSVLGHVKDDIDAYIRACKEFRFYDLDAIRAPWRAKKTFVKPYLDKQ